MWDVPLYIKNEIELLMAKFVKFELKKFNITLSNLFVKGSILLFKV